MAKKLAAKDYSGWTFQPLDQSGNPQAPVATAAPTPSQAVATTIQQDLQGVPKALPATPPPPPEADMTTQDPHTFATLAANKAIENMRQQGAQPLVEDFKKIYESSFNTANDFRKTLATQYAQQQSELQKAQILQQSAAQIDVAKSAAIKQAEIPLLEKQKLEEAQTAEGLTMAQAQAQWESAGNKGTAPLIKSTPTTELDKAAGFINGYKNVTDLHDAFNNMIQNAPGTGGVLKSTIGGLFTQPGLTSPQTRAFNSVLDSSLVPLARGVFGDTGATAGKELIQAQMKDALPNASDNAMSGGQKIYMLKKRIRDNLQTQRSLLAGHYDTSTLDTQLAGMNSDLDKLDQYNPLKAPGAVVQNGLSPVANANLNAKIAPQQGQQPQQPQPQLPPPQTGQSPSAQTSLFPAMAN
jgi:hypothetical protein